MNNVHRSLGITIIGATALISAPLLNADQSQAGGEKLYSKQCASCHGAKGEGGKGFQKPLAGTRTVSELSQFISKTMPPGPNKCASADAKLIASFMYDAFYSPVAQARNQPPRIALSRLTVRQFRYAISDLFDSFHNGEKPSEQNGLQAEYFRARRFNAGERVISRVDPEVNFDFGVNGPIPDKFDPHQFSILWQGGVLAPDSGEYDFVIKTDHALRLFVNDPRTPIIDAWVKSGTNTEFHGTVNLLGGRTYPIRLEFSKSTQGVDDTAKKQGKPAPPAFISLNWKRPKQSMEVIPKRCLFAGTFHELYVSTAPFPPDDRSIGYERGTSVNKAWDEATTAAALDAAGYAAARFRELVTTNRDPAERINRLRTFCKDFVGRAFRRPLTPELEQFYIQKQLDSAKDPEIGLKRVVILALKSPRFLYREIDPDKKGDAFDTASRLAFGIWDSVPDNQLYQAAGRGELVTREQISQQAERMLNDPRAWTKLKEFLMLWLKVDMMPDLAKDSRKFPDFDASVATDLRSSLELFLEQTAWGEKSDFRDMMLTDRYPINGRLAKIYGVNLPPDSGFQTVALDSSDRSGVLTHPYMLSSLAYINNSSPIHRGVLIIRNVMGRLLQPPPAAVAPEAADLHPNMTTRQRVAMQTKPAFCSSCHDKINPVGFTLEKFDAIGRLRQKENGQPVDASGSYITRSGKTVAFSGIKDLTKYAVSSDETQAAFVEKLFQFMVKQPIRAYGQQALPDLQRRFISNNFSIKKLMVEIMATSASHG